MSKVLKLRNPKGKASPNYKLKTVIYKAVITRKANFKEKGCIAKWGLYKSRYHCLKPKANDLSKQQVAITSLPAAYCIQISNSSILETMCFD